MKKLSILNLDELYNVLKEKSNNLSVDGYEVVAGDVDYNGEKSLLNWFFKYIKNLKKGCKNLTVAKGTNIATNNYMWAPDTVTISSQPTELGLLVKINKTNVWYSADSFSGVCHETETSIFLLDVKEN